jgi:hypothetical protein
MDQKLTTEHTTEGSKSNKAPQQNSLQSLKLPLLGSNHDSPDPESDKTGPQFQPNIVDSEGERASVPDLPRYDAGFCREKQTHKQTQGLSASPLQASAGDRTSKSGKLLSF